MKDKNQIINMLQEELKAWDEFLSGMDEEQIILPQLPSGLSIKDVVVHLWAWQQRSVARLEAALQGREPQYPAWPPELDPEAEDVNGLNDWIFTTNKNKPWSSVYRDWKEGFSRLIELGQAIPAQDLFDEGKYPWLEGSSLADVLLGTIEHHHNDHLESVRAWLTDHGAMRSAGQPNN